MTPEEKAKIDSMTNVELYQFLLDTLVKAEAYLLLERSLERIKPQAMLKLDKALDTVQESAKLTRRLLTGRDE